jgi:hypothetical protein
VGNKADGKPCEMGCFLGVCDAGVCGGPGKANAQHCNDGKGGNIDVCCVNGAAISSTGKLQYPTQGSEWCTYLPSAECIQVPVSQSVTCVSEGCYVSTYSPETDSCVTGWPAPGTPCGKDACGQTFSCSKANGGCVSDAYGNGLSIYPSYSAPCDDDNTCTSDWCGGFGCCRKPTSEGQPCAQGGHCLKGNCVPD